MIYIPIDSTDVYRNFALEYYFAAEKHLGDDIFLFWRTTPTVMVGKYQLTLNEIRQDYVQSHGIHVVRRMSGGGTIYTDLGGWQFTFIRQDGGEDIQFQQFTQPVIQALHALGVNATYSGRNDLLIDGRKFSGNAQYKLNGVTVHHGSLLYNTDIEQMVQATSVSQEKIVSKSIHSVRERVTNICEHLPHSMDDLAFRDHMVRHIAGDSAATYAPTDEDNARIDAIAREKFASWDWCYGKNPRFSIQRAGRLTGGRVEFQLDVNKGVITAAALHGDFFGDQRAEDVANCLIGCRYDHQAILTRLTESGLDGAIYGMNLSDIAAIIAD